MKKILFILLISAFSNLQILCMKKVTPKMRLLSAFGRLPTYTSTNINSYWLLTCLSSRSIYNNKKYTSILKRISKHSDNRSILSFIAKNKTYLKPEAKPKIYKHIEQDDNGHYLAYTDKKSIKKHKEFIAQDLYNEIVSRLPITCVDVFVYNPLMQKYFTLVRTAAPPRYMRWIPGGRLLKGETFFEGAMRKCEEDAFLKIEPLDILDVYATYFPDSEWQSSTHTINVVVLAVTKQEELNINGPHADAKWVELEKQADNIYIEKIRLKAAKIIKEL